MRSPTLNEKATYHGIRDQPSLPSLSCHCRHNHCCCSARHGRLGERTGRHSKPDTAAHDQAGTNTSFASLKQIDAGVLNVGYAEAGPADSPVVILLHGWPYDIHSYVDVAPLLASAGYGVIVPYLRGYGSTRFLSSDTIQLTREGTEPGIDHVTAEQEAAIYKGVSQVLFDVLKKPPEWTWVVFQEVTFMFDDGYNSTKSRDGELGLGRHARLRSTASACRPARRTMSAARNPLLELVGIELPIIQPPPWPAYPRRPWRRLSAMRAGSARSALARPMPKVHAR